MLVKLKCGDSFIEVDSNYPDEKMDILEKKDDLEKTQEIKISVENKDENIEN